MCFLRELRDFIAACFDERVQVLGGLPEDLHRVGVPLRLVFHPAECVYCFVENVLITSQLAVCVRDGDPEGLEGCGCVSASLLGVCHVPDELRHGACHRLGGDVDQVLHVLEFLELLRADACLSAQGVYFVRVCCGGLDALPGLFCEVLHGADGHLDALGCEISEGSLQDCETVAGLLDVVRCLLALVSELFQIFLDALPVPGGQVFGLLHVF